MEIKYEKILKSIYDKEKLKILKTKLFFEIIEYQELIELLKQVKIYEEKLILIKKKRKLKIKINKKNQILKKLI